MLSASPSRYRRYYCRRQASVVVSDHKVRRYYLSLQIAGRSTNLSLLSAAPALLREAGGVSSSNPLCRHRNAMGSLAADSEADRAAAAGRQRRRSGERVDNVTTPMMKSSCCRQKRKRSRCRLLFRCGMDSPSTKKMSIHSAAATLLVVLLGPLCSNAMGDAFSESSNLPTPERSWGLENGGILPSSEDWTNSRFSMA